MVEKRLVFVAAEAKVEGQGQAKDDEDKGEIIGENKEGEGSSNIGGGNGSSVDTGPEGRTNRTVDCRLLIVEAGNGS